MTKFIKVSNGIAAITYYNANQIISIQEVSSDLINYQPRLHITLSGDLNGADCHFSLDTSFNDFLEWLKSDIEILSVPEYPEITDELDEE